MQGFMDTFISNSAYNVINLYDMRIESQMSTKKAKFFFALTRELIRYCGPTFGEAHATPLSSIVR